MKSILLATDLSANSDRAFERAVKLAKQFNAKLHVIHVTRPFLYPNEYKETHKPGLELEKLLNAHLIHHTNNTPISAAAHVVEGEAVVEILSAARKVKADLVVMGMHNKNKKELRDMFIGTTIERVIRKGTLPVLMVKNKPLHNYKEVLVGTDFGACSRKTFRLSSSIAPKASFHLVHVFHVPFSAFINDKHALAETKRITQKSFDDYLEAEKQHFKKHDIDFPSELTVKILDDTPFAGLMAAAQKTQSDLIALGAHGRSKPAPSFFGSTAIDVMIDPPCDVLISREL